MGDQADMEARAVENLAHLLYDHMRPEQALPYHACERIVSFLSPQIRAAAYARAAEVARNAWVPSYVRIDRSDPEKWEPGSPWDRGAVDACNRISTAILALGEAKG